MKKNITLILCIMLLMSTTPLICGCGKTPTFNISAAGYLYEYDVDTHTVGDPVKDRVICCGKRYKLSFNFYFSNIADVLKKKKTINVTMTVQLGAYDNEDNINLLTSGYIPDGIKFTRQSTPGEWKAVFALSRDEIPDFTQGYFIVGVDSLGSENSTDFGQQPVTVTFSTEDDDYDFIIANSSSYNISLLPTKGNFEFTKNNNIITEVGIDAALNNMLIKIPPKCSKISIDFYQSAAKTEIYGTQTFDSETNPEEFKSSGLLSVIVSDYMKQFLGQQKYNEMLNLGLGEIPVYLVITAVGGDNYNDAVIEMNFNIN